MKKQKGSEKEQKPFLGETGKKAFGYVIMKKKESEKITGEMQKI